jgi:hypothetical protein
VARDRPVRGCGRTSTSDLPPRLQNTRQMKIIGFEVHHTDSAVHATHLAKRYRTWRGYPCYANVGDTAWRQRSSLHHAIYDLPSDTVSETV